MSGEDRNEAMNAWLRRGRGAQVVEPDEPQAPPDFDGGVRAPVEPAADVNALMNEHLRGVVNARRGL